jgi:plasmid stabilization system protein ParE
VTYEVIFTPGAEADLDEIEQYLGGRFSEANAQKYIQRIVPIALLLHWPHIAAQNATTSVRGSTLQDLSDG